MSVPEILRLEAQLHEEAKLREQSHKERRRNVDCGSSTLSITACKRIIAATMQKMELIDGGFTGKLIIAFKEGGVSYIEKVEQFK
jgi:hypothetical protein